jgi:uncharacterized protein (TIGR03437 family)
LGTASRNGIITDLPGNGVGAIVGPSLYASGVTVVAATSNFTLQSATHYAAGITPIGVVAGDFNGDGKHDVAVVDFGPLDNSAPGGISLLLGNGDGSLQPAVYYPTDINTISATAWDFNGDGKDDLAVANNVGTVTILLGSASGKLITGNTYNIGTFGYPTSIAVADVNGDGKADLVVATLNRIVIFLGNGDGTFRTGPSTAFSTYLPFVATGDFNKDGKVDLVLTDYSSGLVDILLGNGDGTFNPGASYMVGYGIGTLFVEDFDGDGNADLVFAQGHPDALIMQPYTQTVGVLFGNGDGTFSGAPAYLFLYGSTSMVAADFNGDGKPDLAAAGKTGLVTILLNSGAGKFQPAPTLNNGGGNYTSIAAGDLNGDGKIDLAVTDALNGPMVFLGNGDGTFQTPRGVAGGGSGTSFVAAGDFNNDHKLDLAFANSSTNSVTVVPGHGDGTFGTGVTIPVGPQPAFILTGDFNRDGNLDLAVANGGESFAPVEPGSISILLGKGDGTFQNAVNYTVPSTTLWPNSISSGDFNKDGIPDLIVTGATSNVSDALVVFIGNGDGTFKPGVVTPTGFGPDSVAVADFNGDGKPDLIVSHCCGDTDIDYLLGNGDGTFQTETPINFNGGAIASVVADFNADGKPDVAFASVAQGPNSSGVWVFLNVSPPASQPAVTDVISASAFGAFPDIAMGSWMEIYGSNLAADSRPWAGSDFTGSTAPTSLDGTGVQVDGKAAFVYYISPGQVNALAPGTITPGTATVTVTAGGTTSAPAEVTAMSTAPGMLAPASFKIQGTQYVVAQLLDGTYVLPTGAIAGVTSRPAKPGETIVIYGIGFGPAENSAMQLAPVGQISSGLTNLTSNFTASFGQTQASVTYAGLAPNFVGLYQFNITVPAVPDSNAVPFTFTLGGTSGSQTLYTAVHQ